MRHTLITLATTITVMLGAAPQLAAAEACTGHDLVARTAYRTGSVSRCCTAASNCAELLSTMTVARPSHPHRT